MRLSTVLRVSARALEVRVRAVLGRELRPYKALLELTSECNSRCVTCDIWKSPAPMRKADLGLPEIDAFFRGIGRDLTWLALSGGEVTLVEHFPAVVASAKRHCPNLVLVTFTTNGLLPEKAVEYALCLVQHGFDPFITVSLDGDEVEHDRLRGVRGNYALAVRTLRELRRAGVRAHFGITLGDGNRAFVRERFEAYRADVKAVTFVESGGIFRKRNAVDDQGVVESLSTILSGYRVSSPGELIEWTYLRLARAFFASKRSRLPIRCDVLRTSVHVRPNGDVHPCMFLPALGNIRSRSFREIRGSETARRALRRVDAADCQRCWMNCYAPHSIMSRPLQALFRAMKA